MKRLKIVEQIIIVLIFAVLIPFVTIGIIISNVSQQSVRHELANNAILMSKLIGAATESYISYSQKQLNQIASGFNFISGDMKKIQYFKDIESKTKLFANLEVVDKKYIPKEQYQISDGKLTLYASINDKNQYYLAGKINVNIIDGVIDKESQKGRNIYIFDQNTQEVITSNIEDVNTQEVLANLKFSNNTRFGLFGKRKNTPKAYYLLDNPSWFVVVDTTQKVTAKTITKARYRIILSLCLGALFIFIIVGLYTFYLYINIRQLFKGITAISKGNYDKKIHLIKSAFTPSEIVFLAKEFNYMAKKINVSYKDLRRKNIKLSKLNEFRTNLVNATSHEFRTPLTSIIGYTSRLLRHDIVIDDDMKNKSLQTIKQQAQRLSRMVEDLLVIPELESYSLKYNIEEIDLAEIINNTLDFLNNDNVKFESNIQDGLNYIYADSNRIEQILINLIDNAIKYSKDSAPIEITAYNDGLTPVLKIKNKSEAIPDEMKQKLFEKFIRVDSELTRTTRGTGLGLYIVKGLCEAMKIEISLNCEEDFELTLRFNDYVK